MQAAFFDQLDVPEPRWTWRPNTDWAERRPGFSPIEVGGTSEPARRPRPPPDGTLSRAWEVGTSDVQPPAASIHPDGVAWVPARAIVSSSTR